MNQNRKRIIIYLGLTFLITYAVELSVMSMMKNSDNKEMIRSVMLIGVMFIPTVGMLLTRLITKEGFQNHFLKITWNKRTAKYYILAWIAPPVLVFMGAAFYFFLFRDNFDWNMSYIVDVYSKRGIQTDPNTLRLTIISQSAASIVFAPILNFIACLGEEWGWRGYLLPKMAKEFSLIPLMLLSGLIWGLWHAPIIAGGHNYGFNYVGYPYTGILMMCLFCVSVGVLLSYITMKTNSCIGAVIAHGSINGIASVGTYFTTDGGMMLLGPSAVGLIGGMGFTITSVIIMILMYRDQTLATFLHMEKQEKK